MNNLPSQIGQASNADEIGQDLVLDWSDDEVVEVVKKQNTLIRTKTLIEQIADFDAADQNVPNDQYLTNLEDAVKSRMMKLMKGNQEQAGAS